MIWQWSVSAPTIPDRRAYLWIPPDCKRVRGVVVALQNMLEKPLFERIAFRAACAENNLALVLIFPGHDHAPGDEQDPSNPKRSSLDLFLNPAYPKGQEDAKSAGADLQKVLDLLAEESGYTELRNAPLMPVGHSSAGSFVWHLYRWNPTRIFAMLPFKTGVKDDGPEGIPVLMIESEWFDFGNTSNNVWSQGSVKGRSGGKCLFGFYVDIGSGHCNVSDDSIAMVSLFLNKVVAARIPATAPPTGPVPLKLVAPESGCLIDSTRFGAPDNKPVPWADYKGDRTLAYWYLDKELADYAQGHVAAQLAKRPQQINYCVAGASASTDGGMYRFMPKFLEDGATFELNAAYLDELTKSDLYPPGTKLTSSGMPIRYRVNSGGVAQVGANRFRVRPHFGPLSPQGNPWEPTFVAYTLGNAEFRPTERPAHATIDIFNKTGQAQTLDFPAIADQRASDKAVIPLAATATSGLPVEYFVVSGPVQITADGKSLTLLRLPPRAKFPVRVMVGAYQWGRSIEPKVQSVGPVVREFVVHSDAPTTPVVSAIKAVTLLPLPDPLTMHDGQTHVTTPEQWKAERRPELVNLFADNVYGRTPIGRSDALKFVVRESKPDARGGKATRLRVTVLFEGAETGRQMELLVYLRPVDKPTALNAVSVAPDNAFAEVRQ